MIMSIRNDGIEMVVMTVVFKIAMDLWLRLGYIRKLLHPLGVVHPSFINHHIDYSKIATKLVCN